MAIKLSDIWMIDNTALFKVHFARTDKTNNNDPLDVFVRDRQEWMGWQEYRPIRDQFNRPFIFSLIQFLSEPGTWLFGGVYRVLDRLPSFYKVELDELGKTMIGRLKIYSEYRGQSTRKKLEAHYNGFLVKEILSEPYTGRQFPGYDNINLSFDELETLIRTSRQDWMSALISVKGVYLITDVKTQKRYVGCAYGEHGIWSRWCNYVESGHGGNEEMRALAVEPNFEYFRRNFRFTLLEFHSMRTDDKTIIDRESFWKKVLLTRGEYGLSKT